MGCFPIHRDGAKQSSTKRKSVTVLGWTFSFSFRRSSSKFTSTSGSTGSSEDLAKLQDLRVFTLSELRAATKNFSSEKLGEGGFGSVYKGVVKLKDERTEVAIKKLNIEGQQGQKEWLSEVTHLRMVEHPNLVKLHGYCLEDDERGSQCLLVYEFMPNKSLDDHIFGKQVQVLPWEKRIQVALGTAKALAYLHEQVKPHIIYRDLKAGNILLDNDFNPKLSDFGLARDGPTMGHTHVTTAVAGTPGYAAPEYVQTGHLTSKSDVWSFGMVLLELLTGRKALDMNRPRSERNLAYWVKQYANNKKKFRKLIDPGIKRQVPVDQAKSFLILAQKCTAKLPKSRPSMSEVVKQLGNILDPVVVAAPNGGGSMASLADISATGSDLTTFYESQDMSSGFTSGKGTTSSSDGFSHDHIHAAERNTLSGEETDIQTHEDHAQDRKTISEGKSEPTEFEETVVDASQETDRNEIEKDVDQPVELQDHVVESEDHAQDRTTSSQGTDEKSEPAVRRAELGKEETVVDTSEETERNDIEKDVEHPQDQVLEGEGNGDEEHRQGEVGDLTNEARQEQVISRESERKLDFEAETNDVPPAETAQQEVATAAIEHELNGRSPDRSK